MEIKKCKCGCNTEIVVDNGKVFSDHTSKWMTIKDWNELTPQNKIEVKNN